MLHSKKNLLNRGSNVILGSILFFTSFLIDNFSLIYKCRLSTWNFPYKLFFTFYYIPNVATHTLSNRPYTFRPPFWIPCSHVCPLTYDLRSLSRMIRQHRIHFTDLFLGVTYRLATNKFLFLLTAVFFVFALVFISSTTWV